MCDAVFVAFRVFLQGEKFFLCFFIFGVEHFFGFGPADAIIFALRVSEFSPPRRMVWSGGMPLGLFTGVRTFTLTPSGEATEFHMREEFSGLMAPLITKSIPDLQPSFEQFADGLRRLAEGGTR